MKNSEEPINPTYFKDGELNALGLTKREYFAGLAMQGLLANPSNNRTDVMGCNGIGNDFGFLPSTQIAELAISYTDELLKQLEN